MSRRRRSPRRTNPSPIPRPSIRCPTSANQEDFVSMATFAARRLGAMNANTAQHPRRRTARRRRRNRIPPPAQIVARARDRARVLRAARSPLRPRQDDVASDCRGVGVCCRPARSKNYCPTISISPRTVSEARLLGAAIFRLSLLFTLHQGNPSTWDRRHVVHRTHQRNFLACVARLCGLQIFRASLLFTLHQENPGSRCDHWLTRSTSMTKQGHVP